MSDEPRKVVSSLLDACIAILLASMALWGAIAILEGIWIYLCILIAVIGILGLISWIIVARFRRW